MGSGPVSLQHGRCQRGMTDTHTVTHPSIIQGSHLSWNSWNSWICPEIVLKSAIVLKFYSFGQNVTFVMLSLRHCFCFVLYLVNRLVTFYCFMCNIALVTFLGLQHWSASINNIYEHRKTCIFLCIEPHETDNNVLKLSWNFLKIESWNFTSCCWEPWLYDDSCEYRVMYSCRVMMKWSGCCWRY